MSKYADEAKKILVLLLGGGHPEELKAMKYVMDEAEILGKQRTRLFNEVLESLQNHTCSCHTHWELGKILKEIQAENIEFFGSDNFTQ